MIPIFFSIDDAYAPYLAVALRSAICHADPDRTYKAIVLYQSLSEENRSRLSGLATKNFSIEFSPMEQGLDSITDTMSNRLRCDYFTLTIYFRLFIPRMFPQYDKAIYIDSDVVVLEDLAKLYDTDLGEALIGACVDRSVGHVPPLVRYMEEAVGIPKEEYINSGVLLMDLKKLREAQLDDHFLHLLSTYHFDCIAPDQDYINALCYGKIRYLDDGWDTMPDASVQPKEPKLIHYNLFSKPWCYDGIAYSDEFWHYAKDSGYETQIRAFKEGYTEEQKRSDSQCLEKLLQRGAQIPDQAVTFKKMFQQGVKIRL
ncbi:MAG: glycosyltransferase family 8 protein [Oscillospiraceae bacterium]|nr:glycosyltransferase family 8 protein [Oscillospiraceae bacterium]